MIPVRRLNHAVLFVGELERAVEFYTGVLGMSVVVRESRANAAFLRAAGSDNHHDLGLFGLGAQARKAPRGSTGLFHLAWQVDSIHDLTRAKETLVAPLGLHRRERPRSDQEHLQRRPRRQRVRGHVARAPRAVG